MSLRRVVVATDHSELAHDVLEAGLAVARQAGARLSVLTAVRSNDLGREAMQRLAWWGESARGKDQAETPVDLVIRVGLPGIEICRYAEDHGGDLIVVGRKRRSQMERLLMGDTADAVTRRSRVPCLSIPAGGRAPQAIHAALDGTLRGGTVLRMGSALAQAIQVPFSAVTVEDLPLDEQADSTIAVHSARTETLFREMRALGRTRGVTEGVLDVRHGPIAESLLASLEDSGADTLAIGVHRGGPPGVLEAGSIARHLLHVAPCNMLTIPL